MVAPIILFLALMGAIYTQMVAFGAVMNALETIQAEMMILWMLITTKRWDPVDRQIEKIEYLIERYNITLNTVRYVTLFLADAGDWFDKSARDQMDAYRTIIVGDIGFLPRDLLPLMTGKCTRVKDGDTFVLDDLYTIRMDGINAPEMDTPEGPLSKEYLESLIMGRQVDIHIDLEDRMDHYNRVIGVVYLGKRNICDEMVDAGYAETFLYELPPLEPREIWPIGPRP